MRDHHDLLALLARKVAPLPRMSVAEWAEQNVVFSRAMTARPGPLRLHPMQAAMVEAINDPNAEIIAAQIAAQTGKTSMTVALLGWLIAYRPTSIMLLRPSADDGARFVSSYLDPVIAESPTLRALIGANEKHGSGDTRRYKSFPHGALHVASASAPAELAGKPVEILIADEIDRFAPVTREGNPLALAMKRQTTFPNRKTVLLSTPNLENGPINSYYLRGTRSRWHVTCEDCGFVQEPLFANLRWTRGQTDTATLHCDSCGSIWDEPTRLRLLERGCFIATNPNPEPGILSFGATELSSPFSTMAAVAKSYERAQAGGEADMRVFTNTVLAEPWSTTARGLDDAELLSRRAQLPLNNLPRDILCVTAAADVQADRLEIAFFGHSLTQLYVLAAFAPNGDVALDAVWREAGRILQQQFRTQDGRILKIALGTIDAGYATTRVQGFVQAMRRAGVPLRPTKGVSGFDKPALKPSSRKANPLWLLGVDSLKSFAAQRLSVIDQTAPGYVWLSDSLSDRAVLQLTAERLSTTYLRGFPVQRWSLVGKGGNELLDLLVQTLAVINAGYLAPLLQTSATSVNPRAEKPSMADLAARLHQSINGGSKHAN